MTLRTSRTDGGDNMSVRKNVEVWVEQQEERDKIKARKEERRSELQLTKEKFMARIGKIVDDYRGKSLEAEAATIKVKLAYTRHRKEVAALLGL